MIGSFAPAYASIRVDRVPIAIYKKFKSIHRRCSSSKLWSLDSSRKIIIAKSTLIKGYLVYVYHTGV